MSFSNRQWSKPRKPSGKWVDLQPRDRSPKPMKKVGAKTEFWMFVNHILEVFFVRIALPRQCEIQESGICDGYHIAKAHTRRRTTIPKTDWWHAFRVCWACQECHDWADQGRKFDESEDIIEAIIRKRFEAMGLSETRVKEILIECAMQVQLENAPKYDQFTVEF